MRGNAQIIHSFRVNSVISVIYACIFLCVVLAFGVLHKCDANLRKCVCTQGAILTTMLATRNFSGMFIEPQTNAVLYFDICEGWGLIRIHAGASKYDMSHVVSCDEANKNLISLGQRNFLIERKYFCRIWAPSLLLFVTCQRQAAFSCLFWCRQIESCAYSSTCISITKQHLELPYFYIWEKSLHDSVASCIKIKSVHIHFFIALLRSKKWSNMSPHFLSKQCLAGCKKRCFLFMKQSLMTLEI